MEMFPDGSSKLVLEMPFLLVVVLYFLFRHCSLGWTVPVSYLYYFVEQWHI